MLKLLYVNVYVFLDPGSTLYFVTPFVGRKFVVLADAFIEPCSICTPMEDFVVIKHSL